MRVLYNSHNLSVVDWRSFLRTSISLLDLSNATLSRTFSFEISNGKKNKIESVIVEIQCNGKVVYSDEVSIRNQK